MADPFGKFFCAGCGVLTLHQHREFITIETRYQAGTFSKSSDPLGGGTNDLFAIIMSQHVDDELEPVEAENDQRDFRAERRLAA